MRCFIAFPLPAEARENIWKRSEALRKKYTAEDAKVSWVKPDNMHITLAFLGEIDGERLERVKEKLESPEIAAREIRAELSGIGRFPFRGNPRIITAVLGDGSRECEDVEFTLRKLLKDDWKPDKNTYTAHITLGRVRFISRIPRFETEETVLHERFTLSKITLFESRLEREGAEYLPLKTIELGKK